MPAHATAPHLAQRELIYASPERIDEFFAAVVHGLLLSSRLVLNDAFMTEVGATA